MFNKTAASPWEGIYSLDRHAGEKKAKLYQNSQGWNETYIKQKVPWIFSEHYLQILLIY